VEALPSEVDARVCAVPFGTEGSLDSCAVDGADPVWRVGAECAVAAAAVCAVALIGPPAPAADVVAVNTSAPRAATAPTAVAVRAARRPSELAAASAACREIVITVPAVLFPSVALRRSGDMSTPRIDAWMGHPGIYAVRSS
jgi:hypothetical protein